MAFPAARGYLWRLTTPWHPWLAVCLGSVLLLKLLLFFVEFHYPNQAARAAGISTCRFGGKLRPGFDLSARGQGRVTRCHFLECGQVMTETYQSLCTGHPEGRIWTQSDHLNPAGFR